MLVNNNFVASKEKEATLDTRRKLKVGEDLPTIRASVSSLFVRVSLALDCDCHFFGCHFVVLSTLVELIIFFDKLSGTYYSDQTKISSSWGK